MDGSSAFDDDCVPWSWLRQGTPAHYSALEGSKISKNGKRFVTFKLTWEDNEFDDESGATVGNGHLKNRNPGSVKLFFEGQWHEMQSHPWTWNATENRREQWFEGYYTPVDGVTLVNVSTYWGDFKICDTM